MTNLNCGKAALLKFTKFMYYDNKLNYATNFCSSQLLSTY